MFQKNINALKSINNELAEKLINLSLEDAQTIVAPHYSKSNHYIIALNNFPLEDIENPIESAKNVWNEQTDKNLGLQDFVLIFGLGMGYLLKRASISCLSNIFLYEPNLHVLRFVLNYVDFSDIFSKNNFYISDNINDIFGKFEEKYLSKNKVNVVVNKYYLALYQNELEFFTKKIMEIGSLKANDCETIKQTSKIWVDNILKNTKKLPETRPLHYFKDKFKDKTAIILAAGPSLKDDIELIKQNRDKFYIFSVNKILNYLIENGITPDFVVLADSYDVYQSFEKNLEDMKNINLIMSYKSHVRMFYHLKAKSKIIFYPINSHLISYLLKNSDKEFFFSNTSGTTSIYAFESARIMGCKNIIFSGLDLAFDSNTIYATGREHSKNDDSYYGGRYKIVQVKNCKGEIVNTRIDYAMFIKHFEDILQKFPFENLYNTTNFGAYIEGMKFKSLSEILDSEEINSKEDKIDVVNNVFAESADKWNEDYKNIADNLKECRNNLRNIKIEYNDSISDNILYPLLYLNDAENITKNLKKILNNPILCEFFQGEVLDCTTKIENTVINSLEEHKQIKLQENEFLKKVEENIEILNNYPD